MKSLALALCSFLLFSASAFAGSGADEVMRNLVEPMNSLQRNECDLYLQEYSEFRTCLRNDNCDEVFQRWVFSDDTPASLYPFNIAISEGHMAATAVMISVTGDVAAGGLTGASALALSGSQMTRQASTRAVLKLASKRLLQLAFTASLGSTGIGLLILAAEGISYASKDSCPGVGEVGFENLSEDCQVEVIADLEKNFTDQLEVAADKPEVVRDIIWEEKPNGVYQKLICTSIQQKVFQWRQNFNKISCEGRLVRINGDPYIMQDDGIMIRHTGRDFSLVFDFHNDRLIKQSRNNKDYWVFEGGETPDQIQEDIQSVFPHLIYREVEEWAFLREIHPLIIRAASQCNNEIYRFAENSN